ncbi:type II toxin-antitoxin system RelE/ParE family toxin [uncultured Hymenobacter sp.]|uniref:type II toxin-antitoxin system RelE family toxin n=1 Tax=uncultured Hymenobacter sp. TaxID=170016 RepID=UPI0035CAF094
MSYQIEALPNFERELKRLSKKYLSLKQDLAALVSELTNNPTTGTALGQNCYKIRLAITSKQQGKSGGARVITCVVAVAEKLTLLSIYDKSEQTDIPLRLLQKLIEEANL